MAVLTYQYRIKDATSAKHLVRMGYSVNTVWNYCNETSSRAIRRDGRWLTAYDLHKLTAGTSKDLGLSADSIQQVCTEYVTRRKQFKKAKLHWRSRKRSLGWIPFKAQYVTLDDDTITYYGHTFRLWLSRPVVGRIKTGSFTQDARGRWYVNLQCEVPDVQTVTPALELGIDLGLTNQIACSDGTIYARPNTTKQWAKKLAVAQRAGHAKQTKNLHAKLANIRKDWTHKATTAIVRRASLIVVGDVSSLKLVKTRFAKSTYDASWGVIRNQLTYKANRLAGSCLQGDERFSSVTCSACAQRTGPSGLRRLGVRAWTCSGCGASHHRDVNAAQNILQRLRTGRGTPLKGIRLL